MNEFDGDQIIEESRDNPDVWPDQPLEGGYMWTWWRMGPHPQGIWRGMNWSSPATETQKAYLKNREEFPVFQDRAHGSRGDFGNYSCHACDYFGDGYPEPGHKTVCDGVCRRPGCQEHTGEVKGEDQDDVSRVPVWVTELDGGYLRVSTLPLPGVNDSIEISPALLARHRRARDELLQVGDAIITQRVVQRQGRKTKDEVTSDDPTNA